MKTIKFKCLLLSDVVLNTSAATEGKQTCLDFIPGNNFLGIVAANYNCFSKEEQLEIFHSSHVRFGDAHPSNKNTNIRALHIPATLFYPKGKYVWDECYAFQNYNRKEDFSCQGKPKQLKQCRNGYYVFQNGKGEPISTAKNFAIKSAYDRTKRRAKDNQMYGYESLPQGLSFLFDVEIENICIADKISNALIGKHHIGRSRTAQYGLVEIEATKYDDVPSRQELTETINGKRVAVYADSRLIFLNNAGQPTFRPTAKQLGLDGEIDWEISQVRTFQHAPWNGKRQTRDTDRCGIEKGSVFFVKSETVPSTSQYVGYYNNEGFGRVIYNPEFLISKGENGKSYYQLLKSKADKSTNRSTKLEGSPLLDYIASSKKYTEEKDYITEKVNDFVDLHKNRFKGESFASQWGRIRKIAMTYPTKHGILNELYDKKEKRWHHPSPNDTKAEWREEKTGYLVHGIAAKKWEEKGRKDKLKTFIEDIEEKGYDVQQAIINLASEMAKICTRNGKN